MKTVKILAIAALTLSLTGCNEIRDRIFGSKQSDNDNSNSETVQETRGGVTRVDTVIIVEKVVEERVPAPAPEPAASPAPAPSQNYSSGVITSDPYAWVSARRVTYDDIRGLSKSELRILRNAIFAHHNYRFKSADLINYFSQYAWYRPMYNDVTSRLSRVETDNINYIKSFE